jgi:hypothetical protein
MICIKVQKGRCCALNADSIVQVVVQITQNLAVVVRNKSFNLQTIYLPREGTESCTVPNSINDICTEIEKTINLNLQRMLNQLESDVVAIDKRIDTYSFTCISICI